VGGSLHGQGDGTRKQDADIDKVIPKMIDFGDKKTHPTG
jgi:hypothetical protein